MLQEEHLVDADGGLPLLGGGLAGKALKLGGGHVAAALQDDARARHVKAAAHRPAAARHVRRHIPDRPRPRRRCLLWQR